MTWHTVVSLASGAATLPTAAPKANLGRPHQQPLRKPSKAHSGFRLKTLPNWSPGAIPAQPRAAALQARGPQRGEHGRRFAGFSHWGGGYDRKNV